MKKPNMSSQNAKLIYLFCAIGVVLLSYFFAYKPNMAERDKVQVDLDFKKSHLDELKSMESQRAEKEANTAAMPFLGCRNKQKVR